MFLDLSNSLLFGQSRNTLNKPNAMHELECEAIAVYKHAFHPTTTLTLNLCYVFGSNNKGVEGGKGFLLESATAGFSRIDRYSFGPPAHSCICSLIQTDCNYRGEVGHNSQCA